MEGTINGKRCREWFTCFKSGDTSLEDKTLGRAQLLNFDDLVFIDKSLVIGKLPENFSVDYFTTFIVLKSSKRLDGAHINLVELV